MSQWNTYGTEFIETDFTITILISIDNGLAGKQSVLFDGREHDDRYLIHDLLQLRVFQIRSNHHLQYLE